MLPTQPLTFPKLQTLRASAKLYVQNVLYVQSLFYPIKYLGIVQDLKLSGIFTFDGQGVNNSQIVNKCINITIFYI